MAGNKFRVWCKDRNEWESHGTCVRSDGRILHLDNGRIMPLRESGHIVQWYTGLPDKNGNDICGGDILDCSYINPMSKEIVRKLYEVISEDGCFKAKCIGHSPYGDTLLYFVNEKGAVIGNIYENPELLKGV